MQWGQSTAFLGAFVASGVLTVVLAYIGKITHFRLALNLWALGYVLNAARLLVYSFGGVTPPGNTPFFFGEWCQILLSLSLLAGVLFFVGKPPSLRKHILPGVVASLLLSLAVIAIGNDGVLRVAPLYGLAAVVLLAAGIEIIRCKELSNDAGVLFTAVILILWGFHKLDFLVLPVGFSALAQIRFVLSAGFYTAAALGFSMMALSVFHRRLAQAAMENEALIIHFGQIFDQTFNEIFVFDAETLKLIHANKGALANTGFTLEELTRLSSLDLEPDFSREAFDALVRPLRNGERETVIFETRYRRKDGATYDVEARLQLMADEIPPVFVAVVRDITERKRMKLALGESETRLQAIMDHSPVAIVLRDLEGRFLVVNREYLRRTGKREEDVLGRSLDEVDVADLARGIKDQEREMLASGRSRMFRSTRRSPAGEEWTSAVMRFPVPAADGSIVAVGAISIDITEWKRAEEALKESEARLQAIMEHSPAAIFLKDREGRIIVANREYLRRRGMKLADTLGKTSFALESEDAAREIQAQEREVLASGFSKMFHVNRRFVDGREWLLAIVRFPVLAADGSVLGVGGIGIDITREKQAEMSLRENEERLRLVLESTGEGIYAIDPDGCCTLCNPAAARILGYDHPGELLARDIHGLIHHSRADGSAYPPSECQIHRALADGRLVHADDEVFWRRDGRPIAVEFRSNPVIRDGTIVGTVVSFADISQRKRAEAWLLKLSQSVEQSPFGVIITDGDGRIEYANPSFLRETGYTETELKGKVASIQNASGLGSASDHEIQQAVAGGQQWRGEVRHRRKDGEEYWASILVSSIRDREGQTVAYVSISEDISERRRMAEHLRQAQKMEAVGQLTGGIAHDFNNILSVILTSAECLADDPACQDDGKPLLAAIIRAVHRGAGLTERLLAFSRRQDLSPELMDLATVVCEMAEMLRRSLGETIAVSVQAAERVPPVIVDRGQFENALLNLAVNARDAMPQGGSLTVEIARGNPPVPPPGETDGRRRDFVCVTVTDTGIGMPSDVAERVFEPFFTTKGKGQGTGLGLSMVYGFVKQSGGDIVVDSVENKGSSFHLYFPAAGGAVADHGSQGEAMEGGGEVLPFLTVVLAEDDVGVRTATKFILEAAGHRVTDAGNGVDALEILKRLPDVDLLLTDVIMPGGMSGRDLAEAARAIKPSLKVLFTSGYADGRLSMGDIIPGTTAFVPKPYTKENLIGALRSLWFSRSDEPTAGFGSRS